MVKVSEVISKVAALKDKCDSIAKEKSGADYDRYAVVYMKYPDGTELEVGEDKLVINFNPQIDGQLFYKKYFFAFNGYFGDTHFRTEEKDSIKITSTTTEISDADYRFACSILDYLEKAELEYDREKTTSLNNKLKEGYAKIVLEEGSKKLGLESKSEYPTIQATVDFWSLFLVDYYSSKGRFVLYDEKVKTNIGLFKKYLADMIVRDIEETQSSHIDCGSDAYNYKYAMKHNERFMFGRRPLMYALKIIGVDIDDFVAYCEDSLCDEMHPALSLNSDIETVTTLGRFAPFFDFDELGNIRKDIKDQLDYYSYAIVHYVHHHNAKKSSVKNIYNLARFLMYARQKYAPRITELLDNGYRVNVDFNRLGEIILNPYGDGFGARALNELFDSFFIPPVKQDETRDGYGGK